MSRKYHKNLAALVIILALSGALIASHLTGILDYVEYKLYDLRINLLAETHPRSNDIYMILVDDTSIEWGQRERGWSWPWPREAYGEFLDYMNLAGAKSVAFDIIFSEPSVYRNARQDEIIDEVATFLERDQESAEGEQARPRRSVNRDLIRNLRDLSARVDDASFARAAQDYGRVAQGIQFGFKEGSSDSWPGNLVKPLFELHNFDTIVSQFALSDGRELNSALYPIEELRNTAGILGSFTGMHDSDNIIRRNRLFTLFDGKAVPGLAAASLLVSGEDTNIFYDPQKMLINWESYSIPVDKEGKTLLRFRGAPIDIYLNKSMSSILQSAEDYAAGKSPEQPPGLFEDCYIFVGLYAQGLFDIFPTPIASVYPGMGVHVTMLDNLLMGDFISGVPDWLAILIIAASVILVVILVLFSGRITVTVIGLIAALVVLLGGGFFAFYAGYWIPLAAPLIAVFLAYLTATLYSYATEGKDKRFLKNAFSRIISPKLVDQLIVDPSRLKLGGEKRKMTAIFTDIQRFSSISSELQEQYGENGPKVLVNLLNLYLTEMSNIVLANGGTIDKYEGDAIIAFFGAPIWMEDHAARACRSAILMKKRERELKKDIMKPECEFYSPLNKLIEGNVVRKERPLYTRLGINTGDMVVGFMGTPGKMDYTIMGNAVNLAARLEGVNKQYDTKGILISEYTRAEIGDEFVIRPLSRVTVVGIPVPLRLYELFELRSDASPELLEMVKLWEEAFKLYESKNFAGAKKIFADISARDPEDKAAELYLERCEKYTVTPPPSKWDGVDNLTEK